MRNMLDLFVRMFGPKFWNNVIFGITKWNFDENSAQLRSKTPKQMRDGWFKTFQEQATEIRFIRH